MDTRDMPIKERTLHVLKVLDSLAAPEVKHVSIYRTGDIAGHVTLNLDEFCRVLVGRKAEKKPGTYCDWTWTCVVDGVEFIAIENVQKCVLPPIEQVQL